MFKMLLQSNEHNAVLFYLRNLILTTDCYAYSCSSCENLDTYQNGVDLLGMMIISILSDLPIWLCIDMETRCYLLITL